MLAGVTLIALLSLGALFIKSPPLVAQDRGGDLVRQFYIATNAVLAGGNPAALEHVVTADLIDHRTDGPGVPTVGRELFARRLTELRRTAPAAHLRVSAIVEGGEWAAARVTTVGLRPTVNGVPLEVAPEWTKRTEFFRIVDGRVAEYWPDGPTIDLPQLLPPIEVAAWVTDTSVSLARLTFPPGATLRDLTAPGEHLILLERGELAVSLSGSAQLLAVARPESGWHETPASGQQLVLRAGDALLVPPHTWHTIRNSNAGSATVLGVAMIPLAELATAEAQQDVSDTRLIAIYDPRRAGTRTPWGRHVGVDGLVAGVGQARDGPCAALERTQVTVTRFTLDPGAALPAHHVAGIELVASNIGGLAVAPPDLISGATPGTVPADATPNVNMIAQTTGQGLSLSTGSAASDPAPAILNVGRLPLELVDVALRPMPVASCAVSPVDT